MNTSTDAPSQSTAPQKKPHLAYAIATVLGTGYLRPAPGTWGSLVGIIIAVMANPLFLFTLIYGSFFGTDVHVHGSLFVQIISVIPSLLIFLAIALIGVWSASRTSIFANTKDPQFIVIDEVSGQHLTLLLALVPFGLPALINHQIDFASKSFYIAPSPLNWKYLLAGFLLFRLFDIWKPFPIRRLENLPGGWGIMADDWLAAVYAAILLRIALHFNLL